MDFIRVDLPLPACNGYVSMSTNIMYSSEEDLFTLPSMQNSPSSSLVLSSQTMKGVNDVSKIHVLDALSAFGI